MAELVLDACTMRSKFWRKLKLVYSTYDACVTEYVAYQSTALSIVGESDGGHYSLDSPRGFYAHASRFSVRNDYS